SVGCSAERQSGETKPAPDFALTSVDGNRITLAERKGKVVLLDFWATWCPPCRAAIPHVVELQNKYRADGFEVVGMNMDQDPEDLVSFLAQNTVNYPIVKVSEEVRAAYGGVSSIPVAFLLDRQGRIRHKYLGYDKRIAKEIEETIQTLLRESP
ncbi:MAG: TlpA family protein disulfide reductase, partial [Proteobacteria bacterium]|nr:TlpA family protein disulfide reductase [Pseudomonadota bacterium]